MNILITGGCGFIGSNAVRYFAEQGHEIHVLDNLSRNGAQVNRTWIREQFDVAVTEGDVRDRELLEDIVREKTVDVVLHLAGQVAVTTSVDAPRQDFDVNARGTLNVLEAVRKHSPDTIVLNASTNKVYGKLRGRQVEEEERRYAFAGDITGIDEGQPLNFHSPYGCSKGAADQYVEDYCAIYGVPTVNFRQSCIYGPRQFGMEAQGWMAWFVIAHLTNQPITIYGNGKQVRDALYVDDLIEGYHRAIQNIDDVAGESFNVGGGPENSVSLLEFMDILEEVSGTSVSYDYGEWRPGDQKVYVSDTTKITQATGWAPNTSVNEGIEKLYDWVDRHTELVAKFEGVV
ncbi:SDR family NAD(P)-dependent oxidoreductase [Salinibacter ruber]|uniref:SDR family NAD(P)-dependent oxidoreductase n=1 Tax=Salinibacter ruber TaxID=146919 RepID=UPI0021682B85|nr:SDR family NAD(P)-dependent oxidoreductase [Salinibacter ruber]MCS4149338.1 CDP-paratose 2-epimerase [Salinibacter ruber]